MYSKETIILWIKQYDAYKPTQPGEYELIDQLKSQTLGLIAQLTEKITTKRYNIAKIFFDRSTRFNYSRFQKNNNIEETLKSKQSFKLMAQQHGVKIQEYHAENGTF